MAKPSSKKSEIEKKAEKTETPKETISKLSDKMPLSELTKRKEEIETLIASLEDEYREATVSEKSYNEIKKKNIEKLEEIKKRIEQIQKETEARALAPIPPSVKKPEEKVEVPEEEKIVRPEEKVEMGAGKSVEDIHKIETDLGKLNIEIEKLKTMIESIKEIRSSTEDKIQRLMESVGEIRSLVFQREAKLGEESAKLDKLNEIVSEMEPEKIAKELSKRDKEIGTHETRLEKLEVKSDDMLKTMKSIQKILEGMGNLENVVNVSKDVTEKSIKIQKNMKDMERLSDRLQKIYVDLNKKLEEFMTYKAKQEEMEELTKELVKTVDQINLNLEQYAKTEDVNALKFTLTDLEKEISTIQTHGVPKAELSPALQQLQEQKEQIETLMTSLEDEYKNRKISEKEFKKAKEMNLKKLAEIEKKIDEESKKVKPPEKPVEPEVVEPEVKTEPKIKTEKKAEPTEPTKLEEVKEKTVKESAEEKIPPVEEPKPKKPLLSKKERLVFELKDLVDKGLISQEAFDRTKRLLSK